LGNEECERYQKTIKGVETDIEIVPSALRHGKTAEDILSAFSKCVYDETLESEPNKTLVVGYDTKANLIEVIMHVISDEHIVVLHAMNCRNVYRDKI